MTKEQLAFIKHIIEDGSLSCQWFNVPLTLMVAQAILETGWGRHVKGNNLFGIKHTSTTWQHWIEQRTTEETKQGKPYKITATFCAYPDYSACVYHYCQIISFSKHYQGVRDLISANASIKDIAQKIGNTWATDDDYAEKLIAIIDTITEEKGHHLTNDNRLTNTS